MLIAVQVCDALGGLYHLPQPFYTYRRRQGSICNQPAAAQNFHDTAERISVMLDQEICLKPENQKIFRAYLNNMMRLEKLFAESRAATYQDFMRKHLPLYYAFAS